MNQSHMSLQLYKRCARFLYGMKQCRNYIVRVCFNNAMQNARTPLGHNLAIRVIRVNTVVINTCY